MTDNTETDIALRDEFTRNMMSNLDGELHEQITKLQAANAALKQMVSDKDGLLTALRAEREASARDMRERCAKVADGFIEVVDKQNRPLRDKIVAEKLVWNITEAIRALPNDIFVIATEGNTNG